MNFSGNVYIQPENSEVLLNSQVSGGLDRIYALGEGLMGLGGYLDVNIGLSGIPSVSAPAGLPPLCGETITPQPQYHTPQYPSTAFILPLSDLPYFPMQSFIHLPQPRIPTIEQAQAFAQQYTQNPYAMTNVFQHAYPASSARTIQKSLKFSMAEKGECAKMREESCGNGEGLLHPNTSIAPSHSSQSKSAVISGLKNISISSRSRKNIMKNKAYANLIVTLKCSNGCAIVNDHHAAEPSATSSPKTLEKVGGKRLPNRRKRPTMRSQAARMAYKNTHVEPFKFRNVYKFILKNVHGHAENKVIELREKMAEEGFSEETVAAGLEKIKRLRSKEAPMDSQRQSRWKIERVLLSTPGSAFVLRESLTFMLKGLRGDRYSQIMEKNKGTYIEACEKYLKEATQVLKAHSEISHFAS